MNEHENNNTEWSPEERSAFDDLRESLSPPGELEHKVVSELKNRNLIYASGNIRKRMAYRIASIAAALIIGFFAGRLTSTQQQTTMDNDIEGNQYVMLLYSDESYTGKDEAALVREYSGWKAEANGNGNIVGSNRLREEQFYLGSLSEETSTHPTVSGYFLIRAGSTEEALQIAKTHPHLKYNGGIELRPVYEMAGER